MALDAKYCGLKFITSLPHEVPLWTPFCLDLAMPADVRSTAASPLGRERPVTSNTFQTTIRQLSDNYIFAMIMRAVLFKRSSVVLFCQSLQSLNHCKNVIVS